jgi:drug/metabolite transporter (DMT)-like permease
MLLPVQIFHIHLREIRKGNSKWIRVSLVILLGVGVAFIARRTFVAAAQGVGEAFLERARTSLLDEEIPFYTYSLQWSILASVMFYAERRDWTTWAMATIALAGCIVGTGRTSLL